MHDIKQKFVVVRCTMLTHAENVEQWAGIMLISGLVSLRGVGVFCIVHFAWLDVYAEVGHVTSVPSVLSQDWLDWQG